MAVTTVEMQTTHDTVNKETTTTTTPVHRPITSRSTRHTKTEATPRIPLLRVNNNLQTRHTPNTGNLVSTSLVLLINSLNVRRMVPRSKPNSDSRLVLVQRATFA